MTGGFGLEAAVLPPPYSAVVSLLMLAGVVEMGLWIGTRFGLRMIECANWEFFAAPVVGVAVLATILYPLALFGLIGGMELRIVALLLVLLGAWAATRSAWKLRARTAGAAWLRSQLRWQAAPYWLLFGLALVALGPSTNADSLNYHLGVALKFLQEGTWPVSPEWFHSRLAGAGESLVALGLSIGAEQFASLVQWSGIFCLCGLLIRYPDASKPILPASALALVSAPVLLFLVSSAKPQLLPAAMTSLALALTIYPPRGSQGRRSALLRFALVCLLVMTASQMKLSFLISGGVVGVIAFALMLRNGLGLPAALVVATLFTLVMIPPAIWKHLHFGGKLVDALLKPFPGNWPGYEQFTIFLRSYKDSPMWFPLSLLIPASVGVISTVIGVGVAAAAWLRPGRNPACWLAILAAAAVSVLGTLFGQANARFFLEPFVWVLMALAMQASRPVRGVDQWAMGLLAAQGVACMALVFYAITTTMPPLFSSGARSRVMERQADGYAVMRWASDALPSDAVLVSGHSSVGLSPRKVFASDWIQFVGDRPADWEPYLMRLINGRVTHALVLGDPARSPFANCFSGKEAGPFMAAKATRNAFNVGAPYSAVLMKIDPARLPTCFEKK